jgi:hypothetical protein
MRRRHGICVVCGRYVPLTFSGVVRPHWPKPSSADICSGSGRPPRPTAADAIDVLRRELGWEGLL